MPLDPKPQYPGSHHADALAQVRLAAESLRHRWASHLNQPGSRVRQVNGTGGGCSPFTGTDQLMTDFNTLRRDLRAARLSLTAAHRREFNRLITAHTLPLLQYTQHVAAYVACRGEFDPAAIIHALSAQQVYVPVVAGQDQALRFVAYQPGDALAPNVFGIAEPVSGQEIAPTELDRVLTPLLGFDEQGFRLGMAGGFYDRSFAFRHHHNGPPWLIGVAYEMQKIPLQTPRDWDVRLDAVVTETGVYRCNPKFPV